MFLSFVLSCFVLFIYNVRVRDSRESCAWSAHELRVESLPLHISDERSSSSDEVSNDSSQCAESAHGLLTHCVEDARRNVLEKEYSPLLPVSPK